MVIDIKKSFKDFIGLRILSSCDTEISPTILTTTKANPLSIGTLDGFWSGLLDSNQRPHRPERRALPTALNPDFCCKGTLNNG